MSAAERSPSIVPPPGRGTEPIAREPEACPMRLAEFILANVEPILGEWEAFARSVWPGEPAQQRELRDHAADILRAAAHDMRSAQTAAEQSEKSKGEGVSRAAGIRVDGASDVHALGRVRSGFDLVGLIAEYRALRASVIRLWRESRPTPDLSDLDDLTRFNESIDQSLTEAVRSYTQRVDQSRQMFLAILGHDLRNPLTSISISAQLLPRIARLDGEALKVAARIVSSSDAMGKMIGDLLDFTGIGMGAQMPLTPVLMDLGTLAGEVVDELRAAHPTRTMRLETAGDLKGAWDSDRLRQVISNLVGNAVQHGIGPVDLRVHGEQAEVRVSVHNDGRPIPPEAMARLFDPLVRGTDPETEQHRRPGSIGLGLYIAREVAVAHGGSLNVESSAATGTVFNVCLPRRRALE